MGQAISGSDEPALLQRIRLGEDEAFGTLFETHVSAVRRLARGIASDTSEAEDITAETFFRVLQALRRGNGPRDNVRAYLLTVARRVAWEWHGSRRDVPVTDDELTSRAGAGADPQSRTAEATLITRAFSSLPERWRSVLWQTEVEGEQPAVVAPHFGLTPNATAALARRARIGLRAAYLQAHLATDNGSRADGCKAVLEKLGGFTAGSVTGAEARKIEAHLGTCSSCRSTHDELREVCSSLRSHAGAVVLLVPASGFALGVTGAGLGATGTAGGTAGAAGVGSAAVGGGIGGTVAAMGTNLKIGLAVASTAAVGAVGMAAGPLTGDHSLPLGLPSDGGSVELRIAEPAPDGGSDSVRVSVVEPAAFEARGTQGRSGRSSPAAPRAEGPGPTDYRIPPGLQISGEARQARGSRGKGTELPAEAGAGKAGAGKDGAADDADLDEDLDADANEDVNADVDKDEPAEDAGSTPKNVANTTSAASAKSGYAGGPARSTNPANPPSTNPPSTNPANPPSSTPSADRPSGTPAEGPADPADPPSSTPAEGPADPAPPPEAPTGGAASGGESGQRPWPSISWSRAGAQHTGDAQYTGDAAEESGASNGTRSECGWWPWQPFDQDHADGCRD